MRKESVDVALWTRSIINHLYWSAGTCTEDDRDMILVKWQIVLFHLQNQHTDLPDPRMLSCPHPPLEEEERTKPWLEQSTFSCDSYYLLPTLTDRI